MGEQQKHELDDKFYERADAHISLANGSLKADLHPGLVANSLMFAASRFNAWVTAAGYHTADELASEKEDIVKFFTEQYQMMLAENIDSYVNNFDEYLGRVPKKDENKEAEKKEGE